MKCVLILLFAGAINLTGCGHHSDHPGTLAIDDDQPEKQHGSSLKLEFSSVHFNFYSEEKDSRVLKDISNALENNYARITGDMQTSFNSKIDVFIYPDLNVFHRAISYPDAPDWLVGAAGRKELKMVSPLTPGSVHTYESLMKAIVHELTHTVVLNIRKQGAAGLPIWLNEGYAYYEAGQLSSEQREKIYTQLENNEIPTWNALETATPARFGQMDGYPISAMIVEFLVESFGFEKLKQFILEPDNVEKIYSLSSATLEEVWLNHLQQN